MAQSLRDKQKRLARELVMRAAANLIVESGLESLTLAAVAARAEVSTRTLYNYFDSRESLLAAINTWSDELTIEMGGFLAPEGLDTLPEVVQAVWQTWAAQGTIYQAALKIDVASSESGISKGRAERRAAMADAVRNTRPELDPEQAHELAAVFHAITSPAVFERLTIQDGLSVETAGKLIGWTITAMQQSLANAKDPYQDDRI